jgi:hypothetical protein
MIDVSHPHLLFEREKLIHVGNSAPDTALPNATYKVAFVFNYPGQQLPPALKEMTEKMISACKFQLAEAIYVNQYEANYFSLNYLTRQLNIKLVLAFGNIELSRNLGRLHKNRPYQFGNIQIIQTESLENLEKNGYAKKELWGALIEALTVE